MQKLALAILQVMEEVKNLQKDKTIGTGANKYKSVTGAKVRSTLQQAMNRAGLTIIPVEVDYKEEVLRWKEQTQYGEKQKQQVRITAKVTYTLLHSSGEFMPVVGIGTGVDSQDKAPGKATSYALKYTLLNLFIIPTGLDPDDVHSDDLDTPQGPKEENGAGGPGGQKEHEEPVAITEADWPKILAYASKKAANRDAALKSYILTTEQQTALLKMH